MVMSIVVKIIFIFISASALTCAIVFTSYDFNRVSHGPETLHIIEDNRFTH